MGSVTFTLMVITIVSKFTGLLREVLFGTFFGTQAIKDIYVISQSIMAMSFSFLFMSIQSTFIPMYNNVLKKDGRNAADRFTANLTNTFVLIATIIIGFCLLFMPQIVRLVASGFTGQKFEDAVLFSRIAIFGIYFSAMNGSMISYLNIHNNFVTPATTGIINNIAMLIFAFITMKTGNMLILAFGSIIAVGVQYIFFPRALRHAGYHHQLILKPADPHILSSLEIAVPAMFSILVNDLSIIVDKTIATSLVPDGGASALDYANILFMMVQGIVIVSIVTAAYPALSRLAQKKDLRPLKRTMNESLTGGLLLIIPAVVGMMLYAKPLVQLFYERGAFDARSTMMTAGALFWYTPGLIGLMFSQIFLRVFYSLNDTKTPLILSTIQVAVDVTLNFVLSAFFGLNGLAASTMIGNTIGAILMGIALRKKIGPLHTSSFLRSTWKISGISALMGAGSYAVFSRFTPAEPRLGFLLAVIVALLLYGAMILFAQIPEVRRLVNQAYHKMKKRG